MANTTETPAAEQLAVQLLEQKALQINGEIWAMRRHLKLIGAAAEHLRAEFSDGDDWTEKDARINNMLEGLDDVIDVLASRHTKLHKRRKAAWAKVREARAAIGQESCDTCGAAVES